MKPELQIKALAELDGWKEHIVTIQSEHDYEECRWHSTTDERDDIRRLPSYLTSYNAIIPLIQKQSPLMLTQFVDFLCEKILDDHYDGSDYINQVDIGCLFRATPAQLCEALLRATGKWNE